MRLRVGSSGSDSGRPGTGQSCMPIFCQRRRVFHAHAGQFCRSPRSQSHSGSTEGFAPAHLHSSPVPISSVSDARANEVLWRFADTTMATFRHVTKLGWVHRCRAACVILAPLPCRARGGCCDSPARKRLYHAFRDLEKESETETRHGLPSNERALCSCTLHRDLLLPRASRPIEENLVNGPPQPWPMSKLGSIKLELSARSWIISVL